MHLPANLRFGFFAGLTALMAFGLSGCVASNYQLAEKKTPAAVRLGWQTETAPVSATLETVIAFHGPGSWKANAYWDEYVVTLHNAGAEPRTITQAMLTDFQGNLAVPGIDAWALEKASRTGVERYQAMAHNVVVVGVGTGLAAVTESTAIFAGGLILGGSAAPVLVVGSLMAAPVTVGATVYRNVSNKHQIEQEFARRRISLPLTLAPGQEVTGSLFFPVSPGPRRLQFQLQGQSMLDAVDLALPRLAGLHLQPPADGDTRPRPMQPIQRQGRLYATIDVDMGAPDGTIVLNGSYPRPAPTTVEVEVDALGRVLERAEINAGAAVSRHNSLPLYGYFVIPAGTVPPARLSFDYNGVHQVRYAPPAATPPAAP